MVDEEFRLQASLLREKAREKNQPITNIRRYVESREHGERLNRQNETSHKIKLCKNKNNKSNTSHAEFSIANTDADCIITREIVIDLVIDVSLLSVFKYTHIAWCWYSYLCKVIYDKSTESETFLSLSYAMAIPRAYELNTKR